MYAKRPFDKPATIVALGEKLFTRIKDEKQRAIIRAYLAEQKRYVNARSAIRRVKRRHPRSPTSARGCRRARVPPFHGRPSNGDTPEPGVPAQGSRHARMPPFHGRSARR